MANEPMVDNDLVVHDFTIEVQQHASRSVVHHGCFDRIAGKSANGLERLPPGHHDDVHGPVALALEKGDALVAVNGRQFGHDRRLQIDCVLGRAFRSRPRFPDARNHDCAAPMTTFQGRTDQRVTSPLVPYGSALANRSAVSALSARNTSSAPSGGSPRAPASSSSPRACASRTSSRCAGRTAMRLSTKLSTTSYINAKCFIVKF